MASLRKTTLLTSFLGELAPRMPKVRGLRTIKKEILKLIESYVDKAEDLQAVRQQMVPQLLDSVLIDYNRNVPGARDAEVLKAMSTIITRLTVSRSASNGLNSLSLQRKRGRGKMANFLLGPHGGSSTCYHAERLRMYTRDDSTRISLSSLNIG